MTPKINPDGTIIFTLTLPWQKIKEAYQRVLADSAKTIEVKGFRKGKAPPDQVAATVGKNKLYEQAFMAVFLSAYTQIITEHQLQPLVAPQIRPLKTSEGQDWEIEATTAQAPQIKVDAYQQVIKGAAKPAPEDKKLSAVFDSLLDHFKFAVSPLLIDQEKNQALSRLLDQVNQLGLTLDQYLTSTHRTSQQLQQEYALTAATNLRLEFLLQAIAADLHISPAATEIDRVIAQAPQADQSKLNQPQERAYIAAILRKRQTVDALLKL